MARSNVLTDAVIRKRLRRISKKCAKDVKKKVRRRELSAESLELHLPTMAAEFEHLRAELRNALDGSLTDQRHERAKLAGQIENELNTLGNDAHRLQQSFQTLQKLALEAELADVDMPAENKITIEPLRKRFKDAENRSDA